MIFGLGRISNVDHREQCRAYALELLDTLKSVDLMPEFIAALENCYQQLGDDSPSVNRRALQDFYMDIKRARQIDEEPYHALLSSPVLIAEHEEIVRLHRLTALVLIASISGEMIDTRVSSALRQLRLLAMGLNSSNSGEERAVSVIPMDVGKQDQWLKDLHVLMNLDNKTMRNRFTPIHRLLEDFVKGGPKNVKHRNASNNIREGTKVEAVSRINVDKASDVASIRIHEFRKASHSDCLNTQEHIADQAAFSRIVDMELIAPEAVRASLALQNQRTRQIANQLIKSEKRLITTWNQLTPHGLKVCVKSLLRILKSGNFVAGMLLLVLLTGLSPSALITSIKCKERTQNRRIRKIHGKFVLNRRVGLPAHTQSEHLAKLVRTSDMAVQLPIPKILIPTILHIYESNHDNEVLLDQANCLISEINANEGARVTLNRIKSYFADWLFSESVDTSVIEWFKGSDVTEHSGIYYSQVEKEVLIELYSKFIHHVLPKGSLTSGLSQAKANKLPLAGSHLFIKTDAVLKLGGHFRENLKNCEISGSDFESFHNQYTAYTYLILNLATGHRPVSDPFGTIKAFSISTQTVYIQDKDVAGQQSGRVLALPDVAAEQYNEYLKYIESINRQFQFTNHHLSEYSKQILSGEQALFFWLKDDLPIRLKPSNIFNEMKHVFPYPVNWHRHHMRTTLSQRGNETQLIDAWMGHSTFGNETFSAYSGESIGHMRGIADEIQDYLVNVLSLSVIEARS
tara:strand:- start:9386 stop:11614 length:2229 start_codon:yes stop_codon:yes gene_type:complete